jgi:predicted PurR-regulated permease PerM
MVAGVASLVTALDSGQLAVPLPLKQAAGQLSANVSISCSLATNMKVALAEMAPILKPVASKLLEISQGALFGLIELIVSIVVAGFLFTRGPQLVEALGAFLSLVLSHRGKHLVQLAGATIRNVSRGVVGIALLQALLGGAGFLAAGIPAAGVLAFVALLLGIVQVGPGLLFIPIVVWSWMAGDCECLILPPTRFGQSMDSVLKPFLMARGARQWR